MLAPKMVDFDALIGSIWQENTVDFRYLKSGFDDRGDVYQSMAADKGEQIHKEVANRGLLEDDLLFVVAVDMYAKCGELSKAYEVLQETSSSDVVSWSALISGCAQQGKGEEALKCFEQMQNKGLSPNSVTYSCVLKACGCIGALEKGEQIHQEIAQQGLLEKDIILGNALVNMYGKCGNIMMAEKVFVGLPLRDLVSWNAMLSVYVQHGEVFNVFCTCK
ncbi:hypothetical protein KP509_35G004200 [Ceratopteris richardii]|uniref:Pentatricopeptide repeat-containing protein n=1 Tax=Ceratopteris richardii TaxID=49495 RepID=A0A8T2QCZ9_CERRI|nr:hypothetical protein KP509_35G004200 [Ceratopteris richardii]